MRIIRSECDKPDTAPRGVALGFYDGMHRGHQQVVRTLSHLSAERGLRSCVYTFDVHPSTVIAGRENPEGYLCDTEERLRLIGESGTDEIYLQRFDRSLADMSEDDFLHGILVDLLSARLVVIGYDFRFGRGRSGDAVSLREWAGKFGIEVVIVDAFSLGGTVASSTVIRRFVAQGRMEEASAFLGREYSLTGTVSPGRRLGSRLGFPTANISVPGGRVVPATGVYASRTRLDGMVYESVTNVGTRPTVNEKDPRLVVESFLLDRNGDFYGREIEVEFLSRIREEIRFDSLLQLSTQIGTDIASVRAWHENCELLWKAAEIGGIPVYLLRTSRFRTSMLAMTFRIPMDVHTATAANLLLRILTSCCSRIPSRQDVSVELDRLYGARIDATTDKEGDILCLHFIADAVTSWIDGTRVFAETCRILLDMVQNPILDEEGLFPSEIVETERANYENELLARWNDREKYAFDQGIDWYLDGTPHGIDADGEPDRLGEVTREALHALYQDLLNHASLTVVVGGAIETEDRSWLMEKISWFPSGARRASPIPGAAPAPCRISGTCRRKVEHKPVEQARILAVYTGLPPYFSSEGMAVNVLNSMLGADTHSLLFEHIREKQGLAYSVFTSVLRYVRGVAVYAGVAPGMVDRALETIGEQVLALADGHVEASLYEHSATMVRNQLLTVSDSLASLLGFYSAGISNGRLFRIADAQRLLADVTPEQIYALAARLRLASVYLLMPETGAESAS